VLRTRHFVNSDVCGRCLNPTERRTRQTDSVTTHLLIRIFIYIYIYMCVCVCVCVFSCRSIFLGFVNLSVWCKYICKYLDINIYIFTEQFDVLGKHFRNEVFTLLRCCAAPIGSPFPTFRDSVSVP